MKVLIQLLSLIPPTALVGLVLLLFERVFRHTIAAYGIRTKDSVILGVQNSEDVPLRGGLRVTISLDSAESRFLCKPRIIGTPSPVPEREFLGEHEYSVVVAKLEAMEKLVIEVQTNRRESAIKLRVESWNIATNRRHRVLPAVRELTLVVQDGYRVVIQSGGTFHISVGFTAAALAVLGYVTMLLPTSYTQLGALFVQYVGTWRSEWDFPVLGALIIVVAFLFWTCRWKHLPVVHGHFDHPWSLAGMRRRAK